MNHTISTKSFAEYLILLFSDAGESITNKKLQKILYYIQAWHLVYFESQLFDETPEAWVHGPVYPTVYTIYKKHKALPIVIDEETSKEKANVLLDSFCLSEAQKQFLQSAIIFYSKRSALELEISTHRELPWRDAREGLEDYDLSKKPISIDTMKSYYLGVKTKHQNK